MDEEREIFICELLDCKVNTFAVIIIIIIIIINYSKSAE